MPHGYLIDVPCLAYQTWEISVWNFDNNSNRYEIDEEATEELGRHLDKSGYSYNKDHKHCK